MRVAIVVVPCTLLRLLDLILEEKVVVAFLDVGRNRLSVADVSTGHVVRVGQAATASNWSGDRRMVGGLADDCYIKRPVAGCGAAVAEFCDLEVVAARTCFDWCCDGECGNTSTENDR